VVGTARAFTTVREMEEKALHEEGLQPQTLPTGGVAVVNALSQLGVQMVFGVPSVQNLPIYDALGTSASIRTVTTRNEHGAAGAADGYSRVSGRLGVCLTSTGPGAANAMGGLVEAFTSGTPVLHLTGQIETRYLDHGRGFIHEVPNQPEMLRAVSKVVLRAQSPDDIESLLLRAGHAAVEAPQGPVSVELPIDVQYSLTSGGPRTGFTPTGDVEPTGIGEVATELRQAARAIAAARRPIIWAGGGAVRSGAESVICALARRIGAGILTTPNARGVIPESDPLCIGNLSWDPDVRTLVHDADLLVGIGTRYQGPNTENWAMALPARTIQIDVDPDVPGRNYTAEIELRGDACRVVEAILTQLDEHRPRAANPSWLARVSAAATAARGRLREAIGPQAALLDELARILGPNTVVVKDSTIPAYTWGNRLLPVYRSRRSIMPNSFAIGLGVPHSIGAAAATGDPVVCMVGDGGLMVSVGELATIAAEDLPVVVLVFSDGGYGVLRNIQEKQFGRHFGVELGRPNFGVLAGSLGLRSGRAETSIAFGELVLEALAAKAPFLIEVDVDAIGPMSQRYTGTSKRPEPAPTASRPQRATSASSQAGKRLDDADRTDQRHGHADL